MSISYPSAIIHLHLTWCFAALSDCEFDMGMQGGALWTQAQTLVLHRRAVIGAICFVPRVMPGTTLKTRKNVSLLQALESSYRIQAG
eukprot:TRINITY_DN16669_c0_g1_i1.p1 TRINITY_DN16669_c0_g1~~TRINITY_DN16669_c0_g1_i1.p1  ORF type:complete len:87 (+),score=1.62 TRINITY_DN16669_c0_g1_i1:45-305(+)